MDSKLFNCFLTMGTEFPCESTTGRARTDNLGVFIISTDYLDFSAFIWIFSPRHSDKWKWEKLIRGVDIISFSNVTFWEKFNFIYCGWQLKWDPVWHAARRFDRKCELAWTSVKSYFQLGTNTFCHLRKKILCQNFSAKCVKRTKKQQVIWWQSI